MEAVQREQVRSVTPVHSRCGLQFHAYLGWPHAPATFIFMRNCESSLERRAKRSSLRPAYIRLLQCTARDIETIPHAHAFRMITFASINLDHRESNTKSPTLWMKYFFFKKPMPERERERERERAHLTSPARARVAAFLGSQVYNYVVSGNGKLNVRIAAVGKIPSVSAGSFPNLH